MAPEVMCSMNHTYSVDFFALGVMIFEMIIGKRPYNGKSRKEIKEKIISTQAFIKSPHPNYSEDIISFTNELLKRKTNERLGNFKGVSELKNHKWLKDFNWNDLLSGKLISPFIPLNTDNFDKGFCNSNDSPENTTSNRYKEILQDKNYNTLFAYFTYVRIEKIKKDNDKETYSEILNKKIPNATRIKDFTSQFNKNNSNSKKLNNNDRHYINIIERNNSAKAIRDNRLLDQLNDFKIKEDIGDLKLNKLKLPKIFDTSKISQIKSHLKKINPIATTAQTNNNKTSTDKTQLLNKSTIGKPTIITATGGGGVVDRKGTSYSIKINDEIEIVKGSTSRNIINEFNESKDKNENQTKNFKINSVREYKTQDFKKETFVSNELNSKRHQDINLSKEGSLNLGFKNNKIVFEKCSTIERGMRISPSYKFIKKKEN